VTASKLGYARAFVSRAGWDPDSVTGQRRVAAILTAAQVCETYAQFTRAAQAAVDPEFGTTAYGDDLMPVAAA